MNVKIIAEGVRDTEIQMMLEKQESEYSQGYPFSKASRIKFLLLENYN